MAATLVTHPTFSFVLFLTTYPFLLTFFFLVFVLVGSAAAAVILQRTEKMSPIRVTREILNLKELGLDI